MLLAIDVGNTTVAAGIFENVGANNYPPLQKINRFATRRPASVKYYLSEFKKILRNKKMDSRLRGNDKRIDIVIISSVVPEVTKVLKKIFKGGQFSFERTVPKMIVLGEDLVVPIKNLYKNPRQVGQDRLVDAYAAYAKFGGGLIIVDFGTATTFDVVSRKGEYMGGIIAPGIQMSINALSEKTALLPKIELKRPRTLIGRDTAASMCSGIVNGYACLCDGLIERIKKEAGSDYKVILTGGYAKLLSRFCHYDKIQPNLTLEGLLLIYQSHILRF